MAIVDDMFCPLHKQGTIFMWYAKLKDGRMVYEYDDRVVRSKWDKFRLSYLNWLEDATQRYYRREISTWDNIKRIGYLLFDNILCSIKPDLLQTIVENKFYSLHMENIEELGIMGNGGRIYFNTRDGIIHLDGNRDLNVFFMFDNMQIDITDNSDTTYTDDLIERHYASYEFNLSGGTKELTSDGKMNALGIGYSNKIQTFHKREDGSNELVNFKYELVYVLPLRSPNYIMLSLTSNINTDIELHLTFLANDDSKVVHLEKNIKQTFTIAF